MDLEPRLALALRELLREFFRTIGVDRHVERQPLGHESQMHRYTRRGDVSYCQNACRRTSFVFVAVAEQAVVSTVIPTKLAIRRGEKKRGAR